MSALGTSSNCTGIDMAFFKRMFIGTKANAYYWIGIMRHSSKLYWDAIAAFEKAIALKPYDYRAYHRLGEAYKALEQHTEALAVYQRYRAIQSERQIADHVPERTSDSSNENRAKACPSIMRNEKEKRQKGWGEIVWGVMFLVGGPWLLFMLSGSPLDELALIQSSKVTPGFIVDTWEDYDDADYGETLWHHGAIYEYRVPDGRDFKGVSKGSGRLKDEFAHLTEPYPIEVEYLPDNPDISRIKGDGCQTVPEFLWRKIGLGTLLLLIFVGVGVYYLYSGLRGSARGGGSASNT